MDLGPHAQFIWLCYAAVAVVVAGLVAALAMDGNRLQASLRDLEGRGVRRHQTPPDNPNAP